MGIQAATLHLPNCPFPACSVVCWKGVPEGEVALGIVSRSHSWVNYKAAGRQTMPLWAGEKTKNSCSWETYSVQFLAGRQQASHHGTSLHTCQALKDPQLMPLNSDKEPLRLCQDILGWWEQGCLSLQGDQSDTFQIPCKKICYWGIWPAPGIALEHKKLKERQRLIFSDLTHKPSHIYSSDTTFWGLYQAL